MQIPLRIYSRTLRPSLAQLLGLWLLISRHCLDTVAGAFSEIEAENELGEEEPEKPRFRVPLALFYSSGAGAGASRAKRAMAWGAMISVREKGGRRADQHGQTFLRSPTDLASCPVALITIIASSSIASIKPSI